MLQVQDRSLQSPGVELLGGVDQDRLRLGLELVTELACGLSDEDCVPVADVALSESLLGVR